MAQPTAPIHIARMACVRLGESPIRSLDPPKTDVEKIMAEEYDNARRHCLSIGTWNFAKKRIILARSATDPVFDYAAAFPLPADYIKILSNGGDTEYLAECDFDIEGDYLLTLNVSDDDTVKIRYIYDHKVVSKWSAPFCSMVAYKLAAETGYLINKKNSRIEICQKMFDAAVMDATSKDGQEVPPKRIQRSRMLEARRRAASGYQYDPARVILD